VADREGGGEPYAPNLVPQTQREDQDSISRLIDLERFLEEELTRISVAMAASTVQAAYGALTVLNTVADQPLDATPSLVLGWDGFSPQVPNRVTTDTVIGQSLVPEEGGIYQITMQISAEIDTGTAYTFTFAVNNNLSPVFTLQESSQQTSLMTFTLHGLIALNPGDVCTIFGAAQAQGSPHTFIMESAIFSLIRVSERNDEPGIF